MSASFMHARHTYPTFSGLILGDPPSRLEVGFSTLDPWPSMPVGLKRWKSRKKPNISTPNSSTPQASTSHRSHPYNAPAAPPQSPFQDETRFLLDAVASLSPDERKLIEEQFTSKSDLDRNAAEVLALRGQTQTKRSNQWIVSTRKIACQIMQFAPVLDVATNAKPEVLSLPWAGIRSLLMVAQKVHEQSESILTGIETALDTSRLLSVYFDTYSQINGTPAIGHLYHNIAKLYGLILKFLAHAHKTCDMSKLERTMHSLTSVVIPNFKTDHDGMLKTVESHARACELEVSEEQRAWINQQMRALTKAQGEINEGVKGVQQTLDLSALQGAAGAAYDSIDYRNHDHIGEMQLCLGGTGKSTIARTVAHELAKQGYLVASFFFKRGQGELSRARSLFPTIARQMADFIPSISHEIAAASRGSPPVTERSLTTQFETLIKGPLSGFSTGQATDVKVIVIDALDECEDWGAIGHAMTLWPSLDNHNSLKLRVFATSRSDNKIGDKLSQLGGKELQHERLERWQASTIKDDLRLFCNDELRKLRAQSRNESSYDELEDDWPGDAVVDKLVDISQPLFIAASTIFREVRNSPRYRLRQWVDRLSFTGAKALTEIYTNILNQAAKHDPEWLDKFRRVIKPIAVLRVPLIIPALTDLLGEGDGMLVPNALNSLSSVIDFPSGKEVKAGSRATVQIYHESFRDFLVNSNLKGKSQFWTDEGDAHGILLSRCIDLLENKLGRDLCRQKDPGTKRENVSAEHVEKHITESVQYACRNWVSHAILSNQLIQSDGQVDRFLRTCLLFWTEAMAWLDKLGEMVMCLKQLQTAIDTQFSPNLESFVADALRWVPAYRGMISDTPLQTYFSALAFAPSNSIVRNSFEHGMNDFWEAWSPAASDWGPVLQTLRGHAGVVLSITPSIDGKRLVTAAADKTIRLWDIESGTEEECLNVNSYCVASSPSGEDLVIIAGLDGDFWKWTLKGEARRVKLELPGVARCVSVSANGRLAAWGLDTGEIYIWDAKRDTGGVIQGHSSHVWCMAFSSDNETLVSGSTDIWQWSITGGHNMIYQAETHVHPMAISPDNKFVVFHSASDTIAMFHCDTHEVDRITQPAFSNTYSLTIATNSQKLLISTYRGLFLYDLATKAKQKRLSWAADPMTMMTFSPDGKEIWCGHPGGLVRQLDVNVLMKHQQERSGSATIAMSSDSRTLASLSQDSQLSLWNIETQICKQRLSDERLVNFPLLERLILISSDNRFVVVASLKPPRRSAVFIWDVEKDVLRESRDKPKNISALAISPDNKNLFCGLYSGQIWIIDLKNGTRLKTFTGHTESILAIAFSPNGQDFASVSNDSTMRIWSSESQAPLILSLKAQGDSVCFSADGQRVYTVDPFYIHEWDLAKACNLRRVDRIGPPLHAGSILLNGRFVDARFAPVLHMVETYEADQAQAYEFASTKVNPLFGAGELWALQSFRRSIGWITVSGRKMLKTPLPLNPNQWFSYGRRLVVPNNETGFLVLEFAGKVSF
ncbi:WD40 repeat-like protein [Piedraia hortae CBS 480.64]|uniref:WD40 repeat-like protein n=1 Tax=Piedraia hortae CBS 480.64 TaxID=1314780 RepID=A0A6A7C5Q3_9PEZI|nr:WD40 repeat-like protein [Piedraia hortae CBS 480.64]